MAEGKIIGYRRNGEPIPEIRGGADGIYYRDMRQPFIIADTAGPAPTTTNKCLWTGTFTQLPANYWTVGKTCKLTCAVKLTAGTAGNWTFGMGYGVHDAPAVIVASTASAKIASVGPFMTVLEGYATCRSTGSAGTISMWGYVVSSLSSMLSTVQPIVFPNAGGTVVSTVDTTVGTNELTFQILSSAGTDASTIVGLVLEALN